MIKVFGATLLFFASLSGASAESGPFSFACHKVCHYTEPMQITLDFKYCRSSAAAKLAVGEPCLCAYRSNANKVHMSFHQGTVACLWPRVIH